MNNNKNIKPAGWQHLRTWRWWMRNGKSGISVFAEEKISRLQAGVSQTEIILVFQPLDIKSSMNYITWIYTWNPPESVFVSPVQPALLPGSPRTDGFHVFDYRSHSRVGNKAESPTG